jgi:hypothetical protein
MEFWGASEQALNCGTGWYNVENERRRTPRTLVESIGKGVGLS